MKTVQGSCFVHQIHDCYSIFELAPEVDDLSRELIEESLCILKKEFDEPFGIIYLRWVRASVDLLAARELIQEHIPHLVAAANVVGHPDTVKMVEYEKTVMDLFPIETFTTLSEATKWITEQVREKRRTR
jgi:hypothetical protein